MIDYHSHILPGMDDGSRNTDESLEMLRLSALQGVDTIIATPHFCMHVESIPSFLLRRRDAHELLEIACHSESGLPRIILGAEVAYFTGISNNEDIAHLCITGTAHLLLEMPFEKWSERMLMEVCNLAVKRGITPVIAHIEQYMTTENIKALPKLLRNGVITQISAESLISRRTRQIVLRHLAQNHVHLLGSDSHNMTTYKTNINEGYKIICETLGKYKLDEIEALGRAILKQN